MTAPVLTPVVGRDWIVTLAGQQIGTVSPADQRSNPRWRFEHASGLTLAGLYPERAWNRTIQVAWTKQDAAAELVDLHLAIQELRGHPSTLPHTQIDATARRARPRMSHTAAVTALIDLSHDFATVWASRANQDRRRALDAVADVQDGLTPRKALQLNAFTLTSAKGL